MLATSVLWGTAAVSHRAWARMSLFTPLFTPLFMPLFMPLFAVLSAVGSGAGEVARVAPG